MIIVNGNILHTALQNLRPIVPRITENAVPFVLIYGVFFCPASSFDAGFIRKSALISCPHLIRKCDSRRCGQHYKWVDLHLGLLILDMSREFEDNVERFEIWCLTNKSLVEHIKCAQFYRIPEQTVIRRKIFGFPLNAPTEMKQLFVRYLGTVTFGLFKWEALHSHELQDNQAIHEFVLQLRTLAVNSQSFANTTTGSTDYRNKSLRIDVASSNHIFYFPVDKSLSRTVLGCQ